MLFSKMMYTILGVVAMDVLMHTPLHASLQDAAPHQGRLSTPAQSSEPWISQLQSVVDQDIESGLDVFDQNVPIKLKKKLEQNRPGTHEELGNLYECASQYQKSTDMNQRLLCKSLYHFLKAEKEKDDPYVINRIAHLLDKMCRMRVHDRVNFIEGFPNEEQLKEAADAYWQRVWQNPDEASLGEIIIPAAAADHSAGASFSEVMTDVTESVSDNRDSKALRQAEEPLSWDSADHMDQDERSSDSTTGADTMTTTLQSEGAGGGGSVTGETDVQALFEESSGSTLRAQKHPREGKSDEGDEEDAGLAPVQESKTNPSKRARVANSAVV